MTKKTEKKEKQEEKGPVKHEQVERVKAEKVEDVKAETTKANSSSTKYHLSMKISSGTSGATAGATSSVEKKTDSFGGPESHSKDQREDKKESNDSKKQTSQTNFGKAKEPIHEAETLKKEDVRHIKHSGQHKTQASQAKCAGQKKDSDCSKMPLSSGQCCAPPKLSPKVEELKPSIEKLKADPKAFKELQHFVRPSLISKAGRGLVKSVNPKYWAGFLMGTLKATDSLISYITIDRGEGRNEALQKARSPILFGMWVLFLFFVVGGTWAGIAPLDKAIAAQGFIVSSSHKQIIQSKEGGIIEAIYAKEGDHIKAGQPLIKLENKRLNFSLESALEQKKSNEKNLEITQEQLKSYRELAEKGFLPKNRVSEYEAREASLKGELSRAREQLLTVEESIAKLTLKSPVDGIVTQIAFDTIGGVVGQGTHLITVTPSASDLILEVYVQPKDREAVRIGLKARVMVSAFHAKTTAHMEGVVTYISPDTVEMLQQQGRQSSDNQALQRAGGVAYKAKISIDKAQLKKISKYKDYELIPGMDASIQISIGERTLIEYLLEPIMAGFWHAFIEK